ncbi:MAG: N-acetylmuramidase family protein [Comamonadaceae bacterium]|nr:MAG: N-acetylmuramidase family protein [Comamonadaceae bacterium]
MKNKLSDDDFQRAATLLRCPVAAIRAVCAVEAPGGGFLPNGQPTILFERHQFSKRTGRQFDKSNPDISNAARGGYKGGEAEHSRLAAATRLDRDAALQSTSWGKFQIMGFNYGAAGFASLQSFINAMYASEGAQLDAFVAFILSERLDGAMREERWADFARRYNGPAFAANRYDTKLAAAFKAAKG